MVEIAERLAPVIAHRGASAAAPENTLAALRQAAAEGARWVEFDVKLSRDGRCILMHDDFLQRTSDGKGEVAQFDLEELSRLDAGSWFDEKFRGEGIPTLEAALATCLQHDLSLNLEIKPCPGQARETARRVVETLRAHWPEAAGWPLLSSFAVAALEEAHALAPEIPRGLLHDRPTGADLEKLDELKCATLHCDAKRVTPELVRRLAGQGRPVLCYTVNDGKQARRLRDMGVASIITDRPAEIAAALKDR